MPNPQSDDVTIINLPPLFDMNAAVELKPVFEIAMAQGAIRVEAAEVERVSTPGLQLLAVVAKTCAARQTGFGFGECALSLRRAATLLDLAAALGLDGDENE